MCLETISEHYCGHRTITKQVCQASHIQQHVKKQSFLSKLLCHSKPRPAKCKPIRIEQKLFTICQLCFQNPELRRFIRKIPVDLEDWERMAMIAEWRMLHEQSGVRGQKPLPPLPPVMPPPQLPLQVRTRSGPGQVQRRDAYQEASSSRPTADRGRQQEQQPMGKTQGKRRRLASPSKYLHPGGYQRDSTPPHTAHGARGQQPQQPQHNPNLNPRLRPTNPPPVPPRPRLTNPPPVPPPSQPVPQRTESLRRHPRRHALQGPEIPRRTSSRQAEVMRRERERREWWEDGGEARPMRREIVEQIDELEDVVRRW